MTSSNVNNFSTSMSATKVAIFGIGGHGRELAWLMESQTRFRAECFVVDDDSGHRFINGVPVMRWDKFVSSRPCSSIVVAIGDVSGRRSVVARCIEEGFTFPSLVDGNIRLSDLVQIGEGTVLCGGVVLTVNITIGKHVHINRCCSISHDVDIGDFCTLCPGVNVSGHVKLKPNVFVGSGATIINGSQAEPLTIVENTVIGAGACVTKSIFRPGIYTGVPARGPY